MSRIGKNPIVIPNGVEVNFDNNILTVKGSKGELAQEIDSSISMVIAENIITFSRSTEMPEHRSKHGLYRALTQNMITGVSEGFKKELEVVGVGFRANVSGQQLELSLGFSHAIILEVPKQVKVTAFTEKGKSPVVTLESFDKQLLGQVAAKIRSFRKPEPYKGKGIKFVGEELRRKAGKSAGKK
ncbi:MAG: 50S ribosomal protein L6 [Bacteroidetes bacterium]|nr:50S ribosomal protein L6 [Bacteroidota bacterium]